MLGIIAGATIFIGLPVGRLTGAGTSLRAFLSAIAVGILLFLFWDVIGAAVESIEGALLAAVGGTGSWSDFALLAAVGAIGLAASLLGLVAYERWLAMRGARSAAAEASGPALASRPAATARQLAILIAVGIGLHNFAEGLAIGQSAAAGELAFAGTLVIGFALHNATEGFGIVAPLAGGPVRPSWAFLGAMGVIGGGPTFVGAMVGYNVTSEPLELLFYALAGGAILFVIGEIWAGVRRQGHAEFGLYLLGVGFLAGVATDLVVAYGGG